MLTSIAARQSITAHAAAEAVSACVGFAEILPGAILVPCDEVLRQRLLNVAPSWRAVIAGSWRGWLVMH
ncbi:hypothetical protein ACT009_15045 [Sphingomonas sp. Tas61C01]|uniref:hypothetical protein n=1 Tax=Sphingomonas sp. Tas61C01 TaxID=3458297 RepID=UPI00403ED346